MKTKQTDRPTINAPGPDPGRSETLDRQLHILDELYRLAGLAPLHAYQAARADLQSIHPAEGEQP